MQKPFDRKLVLENGAVYEGYAFGAHEEKICEIVFNTSMVGYQEIISDPSYTDQAVVMSYPLIGNYGIAADDYETRVPTLGALIVRDYNDRPSNFRSQKTLSEVMETYKITGLSGIDTRKLVRSIRDGGSCLGMLTNIDTPVETCLKRLKAFETPHDAVKRVSRRYMEHSFSENGRFHVVAVDCGMKENIVRCLNRLGCNVTIVPYDTSAEAIYALRPNGLFISNGPGNPEDVTPVIRLIREMKGTLPIFGICLGHQMIALAYGAKTYKLKFGHRGGNHPVKHLQTGKIEITSQNHSYAVEPVSLKQTRLEVTHINLLDQTVEGVRCSKDRVFSVQYHPESAPGPQDSAYLFDTFIRMMEETKNAQEK